MSLSRRLFSGPEQLSYRVTKADFCMPGFERSNSKRDVNGKAEHVQGLERKGPVAQRQSIKARLLRGSSGKRPTRKTLKGKALSRRDRVSKLG